MKPFYIFPLFLFSLSSAFAFGPRKPISNPTPVPYTEQSSILIDKTTLFVTHATNAWEGASRIKAPLDQIIQTSRNKNLKIAYLMDSVKWENEWFTNFKKPTHVIYSEAGEHFTKIRTNKIIFTGGYFRACFSNSIFFSLESYLNNTKNTESFELYIPMNAIYANS